MGNQCIFIFTDFCFYKTLLRNLPVLTNSSNLTISIWLSHHSSCSSLVYFIKYVGKHDPCLRANYRVLPTWSLLAPESASFNLNTPKLFMFFLVLYENHNVESCWYFGWLKSLRCEHFIMAMCMVQFERVKWSSRSTFVNPPRGNCGSLGT